MPEPSPAVTAALVREQRRAIGERLELQRVAAGIEQEHRGLLAGLALAADRRLDHETRAGRRSRRGTVARTPRRIPPNGTERAERGTRSPACGILRAKSRPKRPTLGTRRAKRRRLGPAFGWRRPGVGIRRASRRWKSVGVGTGEGRVWVFLSSANGIPDARHGSIRTTRRFGATTLGHPVSTV